MSKVSDFFKTLFTGFGEKAKLGLSLAFLLLLVLMFVFGALVKGCADAQAVTYHCDASSVTLNVTETGEGTECPECPPPPECPPLACEDGYSCQPDAVEPPDGEQQQYPPADAELWVQSITGANLIDVMLDDPRWGNREEGEVYARENNDFITWYWPAGGEATFDPTRLGDTAAWYDYRIDTGAVGGGEHTSVALSAGMNIQFDDRKGGVSIFQRKATPVEPPGGSDGFLTWYVNPEKATLPEHRIYPKGQRMLISAWNPGSTSDVNRMNDHGFTAVGPFENAWPTSNTNLRSVMERAKELGMRTWAFMHNNYVLVHEACKGFSDGKTNDEMVQPMVNLWNSYYSKSPYVELTDLFLLLPEEMSSRLGECSESRLLNYNDAMIDTLEGFGHDAAIVRTEVDGITSSNNKKTNKRVDVYGAQYYLERWGQSNGYQYMSAVQHRVKNYMDKYNDIESSNPIDYKRVPNILFGAYYEPNDQTLTGSRTYSNYYLWTSLAMGMKSFSLYKMNANVANGNLKTAFFEWAKTLTDYDYDEAFLWGTANPAEPLTFTQTSGPVTDSWDQYGSTYKITSKTTAERQYKDERFIVMTNSHWSDSITVRIGGLPTGSYNLRNAATGAVEQITSSTKSVTMSANGYAIYKVEKR